MPGIHPLQVLLSISLALFANGGGTKDGGNSIMNNQYTLNSTGSSIEKSGETDMPRIIFASYAEDSEQLYYTLVLAESIRKFGGKFGQSPIWIFAPDSVAKTGATMADKFSSLQVELKISHVPEEALKFYFAGKVFAAAECELAAESQTDILVWMDCDTIILREPSDLVLRKGTALGYCPVMHKNIGSLYSEAPDSFWSRLYEKLSVPESSLFPMVTIAGRETIRPYFNAGLLVVRPERGILRRWPENFKKLYRDSAFVAMCGQSQRLRIFLHQTALVGAIFNAIKKDEMAELPAGYNYPLFFKRMYGAPEEFDTLDSVITLRYDVYFQKPDKDWDKELKGRPEIISWLKERLDKIRPDEK